MENPAPGSAPGAPPRRPRAQEEEPEASVIPVPRSQTPHAQPCRDRSDGRTARWCAGETAGDVRGAGLRRQGPPLRHRPPKKLQCGLPIAGSPTGRLRSGGARYRHRAPAESPPQSCTGWPMLTEVRPPPASCACQHPPLRPQGQTPSGPCAPCPRLRCSAWRCRRRRQRAVGVPERPAADRYRCRSLDQRQLGRSPRRGSGPPAHGRKARRHDTRGFSRASITRSRCPALCILVEGQAGMGALCRTWRAYSRQGFRGNEIPPPVFGLTSLWADRR